MSETMRTETTFTRNDYMQSKCTHRDYYGQFVTPQVRDLVLNRFGLERLKSSIGADKNINNIPLRSWDELGRKLSLSDAMKPAGDFDSLAGRVCVLKEAARQVVELNS